MRKRSIVYVDGFNLYYGALRKGPYKWLDLHRFFRMLRNEDDLRTIKYFTARVSRQSSSNQDSYLRALSTLPLVEIVLGRFKEKNVRCRVSLCEFAGDRMFKRAEEKRTDVSIALQVLDDAYRDRCDLQIIVSGDSDLVPAITMVREQFPGMGIVVYVPARSDVRGAATEIRLAAGKHRKLPLGLLKRAQLPVTIADGSGSIDKPPSW